MPCLCTSATLRLFVRSLAQVEVPISRSAQLRKYQQSCFRNLAQPVLSVPSRRSYASTSASISNDYNTPSGNVLAKDSTDGNGVAGTKGDGAIAEFSLDAIDAIAAEAQSEPYSQDGDTPESFVSKSTDSRPIRNSKPRPFERADPNFRRFKIDPLPHSTSPGLPRIGGNDTTEFSHSPKPTSKIRATAKGWTPPNREHWQLEKEARKEKYPEGWNPRKRLSPDAIAGIRALHAQLPEQYNTRALADHFQISPEAISRILSSKWTPSAEEETDRMRRWFKRGEGVWSRYAELGVKPPKKWREMGIGKGKPDWKKNTNAMESNRPKPALITQSRRANGIFKLEKERAPLSLEDQIL